MYRVAISRAIREKEIYYVYVRKVGVVILVVIIVSAGEVSVVNSASLALDYCAVAAVCHNTVD